MPYSPMGNYPVGSKVQHTTRYIHIKQANGKWQSEHRWMMEQKKLGRKLEEGERVFHMNGVKDDNDISNLVVIKFSTIRYKPLARRVVLFVPKNGRLVEAV